ncbi:hypothetical protein GGX14DRAFT_400602 [Mycena pura]|uniref:Uncharacterized protein n=1 Tax=Mycena pura TaxID=153505 RepID=A0AAD6V5Q7_9AGAR|nr:hypothetical protein GGX14DRAFT_400602 [Mycena pura]
MVSIRCEGCGKDFSKSGFTKHVGSTKKKQNKACRAIYQAALKAAADASAQASVPNGHDPTLDTAGRDRDYDSEMRDCDSEMRDQFGDLDGFAAPTGEIFDGDYFGADYTAADFGGWEEEPEGMVTEGGGDEDDEDATDRVQAGADAALEGGYEPPRPLLYGAPVQDTGTEQATPAASPAMRKSVEDRFHQKPVVDRFPSDVAGKPVQRERTSTSEEGYRARLGADSVDNPYSPFTSKIDWEVVFAGYARTHGTLLPRVQPPAGSTTRTVDGQWGGDNSIIMQKSKTNLSPTNMIYHNTHSEAQNSPEDRFWTKNFCATKVREKLGLSYGTSAQLNAIIDKQLPGRPAFERSEIVVDGEVFDLYSRILSAGSASLIFDFDRRISDIVFPIRTLCRVKAQYI